MSAFRNFDSSMSPSFRWPGRTGRCCQWRGRRWRSLLRRWQSQSWRHIAPCCRRRPSSQLGSGSCLRSSPVGCASADQRQQNGRTRRSRFRSRRTCHWRWQRAQVSVQNVPPGESIYFFFFPHFPDCCYWRWNLRLKGVHC